MAQEPILREGMRGTAVETLQKLLHITADGDFGPGTLAHVKVFQAQHGLTADGVVGPATWSKLLPSTPVGFTGARGLDVSAYQGNVDYAKVRAAGVSFVYAKATEGNAWTDSRFTENVQGAHAHGILAGAYHFAHPELHSAVDEAKHFCSVIAGKEFDLIPCLDIEEPASTGKLTGAQILAWVREWVSYVEKATGNKVLVYTGSWFINQYGLGALEAYPLWIASYSTYAPTIRCVMWQYGEKGRVNGITGNVDQDVAHSAADLDSIRYKRPTPPAPPRPAQEPPKPATPPAPQPADWQHRSVAWMKDKGLITEDHDPNNAVSYAELGEILQRFKP